MLSEKAEWQKEKETFTEVKDKLEEQKQVDAVKIQEFNVSQTNVFKMLMVLKCCKMARNYPALLPLALYNVPHTHTQML